MVADIREQLNAADHFPIVIGQHAHPHGDRYSMTIFVMQIDFSFTWLGIINGFFQRASSETELIPLCINMGEKVVIAGLADDLGCGESRYSCGSLVPVRNDSVPIHKI